ncbi:dermonecrotic toxin domain-containing protein [Pseudomonas sp. NFX224]|uniref:dermonecrotic toxin domain-containing protein n=1 Tax=Pseudomonas sp. NFX224 TaxID=3402862 RepID=UPI003AFB239B
MPQSPAPLFFPEALQSPGLWAELGKTHGLTRKDFEWFQHIELATQTLRNQQSPPMLAERILLGTADEEPVPLAGSFVLSPSPETDGVIVYTPYGGIQKYYSRAALTEQWVQRLSDASEDDSLLAFMSLARRKMLAAATRIKVIYQTIDGDVFEDQSAAIGSNRSLDDQAMIDELIALPSLTSLLDTVLGELLAPAFPGLDQRRTQVNFYASSTADPIDKPVRHWVNSLSLSAAALSYYRDQQWPAGQHVEFSHPQKTAASTDQQRWDGAVKSASAKLFSLLSAQLEHFWSAASADGASRREFFARAIREQARAELLLKREAEIITPEQSSVLHTLIEPASGVARSPTLETVRLWEHPANNVELAGSLMISHVNACLYTPTHGLQVLKDYQDLKDTLRSKFSAAGHEDELYGLLSLDERNRFIAFHQPHVTGEVISGSIFKTLFEAIIVKQQQNLEYVLQLLRFSDDAVDIHALFDKALDIRSMINERLLELQAGGRWSTRPVLSGRQTPSMVLADTAAAFVKTFSDVESLISTEFAAQPLTTLALQKVYLENMKSRLAHALAVGVQGEARLRVLGSTLRDADRAIVDTVFNPDQPERDNRSALNGFRPDAYSLILACSGQASVLPLANCFLLTERGGLDVQHSGRALLWTPATGLEVFSGVDNARQELVRRLQNPRKRLQLLENLIPAQRQFHQRYSLSSLRLIEGNVLRNLTQSAIEHFLAGCEYVRSLALTAAQKHSALNKLAQTPIDSNLRRAMQLSQAVARQHALPAWLGMAPVEAQQLHLELLQQYLNNVSEDKDYLSGLPTLPAYVHDTLLTLLRSRFPGAATGPDDIEIVPDPALAGPSLSLTELALNPAGITEGSGFSIRSKTTAALPASLDQNAVRQLLSSLDIQAGFAKKIVDRLSEDSDEAKDRCLRFIRQLPWQLMQHAHALHLQQRLSAAAFDLIQQVLDMPDDIARAAVQGAHAIMRPLALIKTAGATAVNALGLYLIGPRAGHKGPQILYAPYHTRSLFTEFDSETRLLAAVHAPGPLQDLVIRRLPKNQQSVFRHLLQPTVDQSIEITLASNPIDGNLLTRLFSDNSKLLEHLLGSLSSTSLQSDWSTVANVFSSGIKRIAGVIPGKLAYAQFLWQSFKDAEASAEDLQDHHWKRALEEFIAGAVQLISMGRLSLEGSIEASSVSAETAPVARVVKDPRWAKIQPTAPIRTLQQPFEAPNVALKDLTRQPDEGTFLDPLSQHRFAAVAGKVYRVDKPGAVLQLNNAGKTGPSLLMAPGGQQVMDLDTHTVHFGKALSKMHNQYAADQEVNRALNIEARGMAAIRLLQPERARQIVRAIDMARFYAFNSLHNLAKPRPLVPGTRLNTFLKAFFDVPDVSAQLIEKIKKAIVPVCNALVDPNEDFMNTERFVIGSNRFPNANMIAFVVDKDARKVVHFTEKFFDQQLEWYKSCLTEPFDVDAHSQASTLIHEFSHLYSDSLDIASLEARRPFTDLVAPTTAYGAAMKNTQQVFQREALSLATPPTELFARWSGAAQAWVGLDSIVSTEHVGKAILKITGCTTMAGARTAFFDPLKADARIDVILRNADSIAFLIGQMGRQLDPVPVESGQHV